MCASVGVSRSMCECVCVMHKILRKYIHIHLAKLAAQNTHSHTRIHVNISTFAQFRFNLIGAGARTLAKRYGRTWHTDKLGKG